MKLRKLKTSIKSKIYLVEGLFPKNEMLLGGVYFLKMEIRNVQKMTLPCERSVILAIFHSSI